MVNAEEIRLIVCDIDNTVLPFGCSRIPQRTRTALEKAESKGIPVMINTGRHYTFIPESFFEDLSMQFIGTINGACLTDHDGHTLEKHQMSSAAREALTSLCMTHDFGLGFKFEDAIVTYCNHEKFVEGYCSENPQYAVRVKNDDMERSHHLTCGNPLGAFIIGDRRQIEEQVEKIDELCCAWSAMRGCDVFLKAQNKATIVEPVLRKLNIQWENVLGFGDAGNDEPFLEKAGISVDVRNKVDHIHAHTDFISSPSAEDGVAEILEMLNIV